jgi:hypothetical protein
MCSSFEEYEAKYEDVPQSIIQEVLLLTNRFTFLYKFAKKNKLSKEEFLDLLTKLKTSKVFADCVDDVFEIIKSGDIEHFGQECYSLYLEELIDHYESRNEENVILVKLADRIDNTLSDMPSKFTNITKLYHKNELLLRYAKKIFDNKPSIQFKIFYLILIERSIRQLQFIKNNYQTIISRRGTFYGEQYNHLFSELLSIESKFEPYKEILDSVSFQEIYDELKKI